jgi:hypothetical protein
MKGYRISPLSPDTARKILRAAKTKRLRRSAALNAIRPATREPA